MLLKKLAIASLVLATTSGVAFAHMNYKGDYKGEAVAVPCPAYVYQAAPYLGFSMGLRNNFNSIPNVFRGFEGTLSGGYAAMVAPWWYLAGEIYVGDNFDISNYTALGSVKSKFTYGIDFIPGYMITDHTLAYARVGYTRARFSGPGVWRSGGRLGLGLQTQLVANWDLRAEYIYSVYSSVGGANPRTDAVNVGVIYKFL